MKTKAEILALNPNLISYRVMLQLAPGRFQFPFECYAEDDSHAAEQAKSAYPNGEVQTITPFSGNESKTAKELAARYGHTNADSNTTLKTEVNSDASDGHDEMMDLNVYGVGDAAYFERATEYGDPIGERFYVVDIADDDLPNAKSGEMYVIYSPNESATSDGAGFWNNQNGWTTFSGATKFTSSEIGELKLPISTGQDAKWVPETQAEASYAEFEPTRAGTDTHPPATEPFGERS